MRLNVTRFLLVVPAVLLSLAGCIEERQEIGPEVIPQQVKPVRTGTAIAAILAEPQAFNGKEVTVSGKVIPGLAFEFVGEQPYRIIQGESLLWVITNDVCPADGSFVTVRGGITGPYQIKGRAYELVLLEKERR